MIDNAGGWISRADAVLALGHMASPDRTGEAVQFATSMLTALYGSESPQLKAFRSTCEAILKQKDTVTFNLLGHAYGTIRNAKAELQAGLIIRLRVLVAGEILAELVRMGKETLEEKTDAAKNVAAVLIAAAFEDLIRRMGEEFAGVADRQKLENVINALKSANIIKGGQIGTALSFLKFRNDSLHADWDNVDRSQVESCIALIDALLVKHFS
jgi:hypothetical protein